MKNKKFALTLALEENEELMAEIDALIRERAKSIVREEAEKMLGGSIQEEAERVAKAKLDQMKAYEFNHAMEKAIRHHIVWSDDMRKQAIDAVRAWCNEYKYTINTIIADHVETHLRRVVPVDVIKAVTAALTNK